MSLLWPVGLLEVIVIFTILDRWYVYNFRQFWIKSFALFLKRHLTVSLFSTTFQNTFGPFLIVILFQTENDFTETPETLCDITFADTCQISTQCSVYCNPEIMKMCERRLHFITKCFWSLWLRIRLFLVWWSVLNFYRPWLGSHARSEKEKVSLFIESDCCLSRLIEHHLLK